jgi:HAD superfamily hydrolase (TIGR01549 family)
VVLSPGRSAAAALLLDVDGTLVDSAYLHTLAWQRACSAHGFDVPAYRIHRLIGMGGDQLVPALLGERIEHELGDALRAAWQEHYEALIGEVRALPGAAELIRRAHEGGWNVVLASSSPAGHLDHYLRLLDATGLHDRATTSDDVSRTKPAPDIVAVALELAGTSSAVLVGDSTHDVRAATQAGIGTVCVLTGGYGEAELREAGALAVHETPAQLAGRLDDLERLVHLAHA